MRCLAKSRGSPHVVLPNGAGQFPVPPVLTEEQCRKFETQARGYALTPGIWLPEQVAAWQRATRAVHAQDGRMVLQL